jgi:hypothetical protein
MATAEKAPAENVSVPIVVDLGRKRRKRIRQLKQGRGPLLDEVRNVLDQVTAGMGAEAADKHFVPVVLIYGKKRKRGRGLFPFS